MKSLNTLTLLDLLRLEIKDRKIFADCAYGRKEEDPPAQSLNGWGNLLDNYPTRMEENVGEESFGYVA